MLGDRRERLREPALDRLGELGPQPFELLQALLEILPLSREIVEPLLLRLVLLARQRIDLTERRTARLETLDTGRELVPIVALRRCHSSRRLESAGRFARLRVDSRDLDLGGRERRARLVELRP